MKALVPIKRVADYNVKVRVKSDGSGMDLDNVRMSMNPFDEVALEAAVRLAEAGKLSEIVAISIGPPQAQEILRVALAMGAHRAILLLTDSSPEPLAVARILKAVADVEKPSLIITGKQAIDDDCAQTGQMLSSLLKCSLGCFVSAIDVHQDHIIVESQIEGGTRMIKLSIPAVITVDLHLNEPRYLSLPNIMRARQKTIEEKPVTDFGIDLTPRLEIIRTEEFMVRRQGIRLSNPSDLLEHLRPGMCIP